MKRSLVSRLALRSALAISLASSMILAASAGSDHKSDTASSTAVSISNFGKVNDHLYRGSQPKGRQYQELRAIGVKTVVDLRADAQGNARAEAERAGLRYISLPLDDKRYPQADAATRFMEIVNNQENWPVYAHCAGGRHRTGAMVAVYRMTADHWTIDQAYDEMKQYDFYTSNGHGCYKDYVYDYYRDLQAQQAASSVAAPKEAIKDDQR